MRLLIICGLPGTGKSTLARQLATRYRVPLLAKDTFKEALLDAAGTVDAARSRELSNLSFDMLFAQLRQHAHAGLDVVLEGNFRAGQHEPALRALPAPQLAQVLCRIDETERLRRIAARRRDPHRHPGHGDAAAPRDPANDAFLDLPGQRLLFDPAAPPPDAAGILRSLDQWWQSAAVNS